jgi:hypothetical protein
MYMRVNVDVMFEFKKKEAKKKKNQEVFIRTFKMNVYRVQYMCEE